MPRESASAIEAAMLHITPNVPGGGRPQPPAGATAQEAAVWEMTVAALPAGWFSTCLPLLAAYCRHAAASEVLGQQYIAALATDATGEIGRLSRLCARETASLCSLATRLRIAKLGRARIERDETAIRNVPHRRLWERTTPT